AHQRVGPGDHTGILTRWQDAGVRGGTAGQDQYDGEANQWRRRDTSRQWSGATMVERWLEAGLRRQRRDCDGSCSWRNAGPTGTESRESILGQSRMVTRRKIP